MKNRINTKRGGPIEGTREYNYGYLLDCEFDVDLDRDPEAGRADPVALGLAYSRDEEVGDE